MTRALEVADRSDGGAFYCTDIFGLRQRAAQLKRKSFNAGTSSGNLLAAAAITPDELEEQAKALQFEPVVMMQKKVCSRLEELALVVPCPEDAHLDNEDALAAWRALYPSRLLVIIPVEVASFSVTTSFNILAALSRPPPLESVAP